MESARKVNSGGRYYVHRVLMAFALLAVAAFQPASAQSVAIQDLGTLGGNSSQAAGINNRGQVVGQADTASGDTHAFSFEGGVMTDLGTLSGSGSSQAYAINERGQVVGSSTIRSVGPTDAFLFEKGVMTGLNIAIDSRVDATGINNRGQVVGNAGPRHGRPHSAAFLYENGGGPGSPVPLLA
ncbi:hypothetical protein [Burkholderia sp. LMG 13014]|uniref:hypothetical protein n=1 Tax=Burkholderia sp. LMG 13014 TaxID=2709306 RepID=UPI001963DF32|nr:hypothetical protein [Burkholderia sp. LMG 13014]